ncbi:unnamed protein product [Kluyveromyces dobzhanskii CBS 2104]|uniref:WGS project CCBQ000000000 data, contig 00016 n=1 Tax=Kluyveromyces dobzhanskii CBS 2104 TaxID=1427455 RepID=A0A0A8L0D3_9SACH|nr:unnamed protein product [Kluyveromyces dobzhanskii CBS 2104]
MSDMGKDIAEISENYSSSVHDENDDRTLFNRVKDSFKRQDLDISEETKLRSQNMTEYQRTNYLLAKQPYQKNLSQRHLTMIAIGGTLGTGLFIGIGWSLASGPGNLLIGFLLTGIAIFCVVQCAAEMSCQYPVSGSYASHVSRFVDPSWGFTVATNYCLSWAISFPSELIGCAMTISYWNNTVNPVVWVAIFWVFIVGLNLFGVRGFAETEYVLSIFKIIAIIIFIIIGIVLICGGGPNSQGYIGAKYWYDPGSFKKPVFKSLCNTFVSAAFSFGGTELVVLTAAESRKVESVSRAAKGTFWRVIIFYVSTVIIIGCLVPYNDERLLGGNSSEDITASPFVIALANTGSFGTRVSNFMNAVILIAVLSVCNSCVYAASRVIQSLGASGQLPSICGYVDRKGRPLFGIFVVALFGLLSFIVASNKVSEVFDWLFALCSISAMFIWFSICLSYLRYRWALKKQGRTPDEIAYKSMLGIWGAYLGALLSGLLIVGEVYVSLFPLGGSPNAEAFFQYCLSIPIMIVVYVVHKIYTRNWLPIVIPLSEVDLDTGLSHSDVEVMKHELEIQRAQIAAKPLYYRIYRFWC